MNDALLIKKHLVRSLHRKMNALDRVSYDYKSGTLNLNKHGGLVFLSDVLKVLNTSVKEIK